MMGDAAVARDLSYEDYLALERATDTRHELVDGVASAVTDGTPTHGRLAAWMIAEPLSVDRVYRGVTLTPSPTGEHPAG